MKLRLISLCFGLVMLVAPVVALAKEDEEAALLEGRLEGFPGGVHVEKTGNALAWLFFFFLAICALVGLFKNARRTHLD